LYENKAKQHWLKKLFNKVGDDRSTWTLLISNLIIIVLAVSQHWSAIELVWIYWCQNLIIGFFNWRRILDLKSFSTDGFKINGRLAQPTRKTQKSTATFFLIHYNGFHVVYLIFLLFTISGLSSLFILHGTISLAVFLFNHAFSYMYNRKQDAMRSPNIGTMMFFPYARVIPMHLIIIFGAVLGSGSLLLLTAFLFMKTIADVLMHVIEHRLGKVAVLKSI